MKRITATRKTVKKTKKINRTAKTLRIPKILITATERTPRAKMIIHLSNISIIRDFSEDNKGLIIKNWYKRIRYVLADMNYSNPRK
jgi:hypothetical protein